MNLDKNLVKPYWYIDIKTLVTILKVIKDLDEDLKRKIVSIITLRNKKQEEIRELYYNSFSFHEDRNMMDSLDLWSQNMLLYFLLGKGNYTDEEKYVIMINTFMGKVHDWFSGLTEDAEKIIKDDTLEGLKNSVQLHK